MHKYLPEFNPPVVFRVFFAMAQRLRLIWEEKNINQEFEAFHLKTDIQDLTKTYFCGRFNQPVVIFGIEVETIHFTDLEVDNGTIELKTIFFSYLKIQRYQNLSFTIITPGISRNAFCFCIIF